MNFNIRGRKWEKDGKVNYFSNLEAWRIEKVGGAAGNDIVDPASEGMIVDEQVNDDIPF